MVLVGLFIEVVFIAVLFDLLGQQFFDACAN